MSMKDNDYLCPQSKGHLNVGGYVVFATRTESKHKGLLMLNPRPGDYSYRHHDKFKLKPGEKLDFECPMCQADLTAKENPDFAMIKMIVADDHCDYNVYFSRKEGEKSTYIVADDNIQTFGDDALDFDDIFDIEL